MVGPMGNDRVQSIRVEDFLEDPGIGDLIVNDQHGRSVHPITPGEWR
jgi:Na+-translocating ferredoxin:NAD+ oxidoreductase RnfG subunit